MSGSGGGGAACGGSDGDEFAIDLTFIYCQIKLIMILVISCGDDIFYNDNWDDCEDGLRRRRKRIVVMVVVVVDEGENAQ